jgi:hypothetical protein
MACATEVPKLGDDDPIPALREGHIGNDPLAADTRAARDDLREALGRPEPPSSRQVARW